MVQYIRSDLEFILQQIKISEAHAAGQDLTDLIPNPFLPYGLRTVDGTYNNLLPGQEQFGAADNLFPRMTTPTYPNDADGDTMPLGPPGSGAPTITNTNYGLPGSVADADPRIISNLIVDQTASNPAAVAASETGDVDALGNLHIPNVAPDEGLSAPFNSWMTLFGQFFDHGLDLVTKGNNGTVYIPLQPDDPLYVPGGNTNFMVLTRATPTMVDPDGDGPLPAVAQHENTTTSFVDQNQTYTSHSSHQVFLREYEFNSDGDAVATGKMLEGANGGLATWAEVKAQALDKLGLILNDFDVHNVPMVRADEYGKFIPGPNGYAQVAVTVTETVGAVTTEYNFFIEGTEDGLDIHNLPTPAAFVPTPGGTHTVSVIGTNHAFLNDIAHHAGPGSVDHDHNPMTAKIQQVADDDILDFNGDGTVDGDDLVDGAGVIVDANNDTVIDLLDLADVNLDGVIDGKDLLADDRNPLTYDNELLNEHFITGDGRGNENIGLTTVHFIFHAEHNRLVEHTKDVILATGDPAFIAEWKLPDGSWNGERLFQAARFGTEMQYQHLVFEEFARKVQPMVNLFGSYDATIDPSIVGEFAHVVYRFGHSMLTESIDRYDPSFNADHIGLIQGFLNPVEFTEGGTVSQTEMAGAIIRGMTRQVGNEIDEFVTEALRNNLLGLPLDLATINLARGRDTGVATLNEARREFYAGTGDSQLKPYTSWVDFAMNAKNELSVVNFIAAYGNHVALQAADVDTAADKRAIALALVTGQTVLVNEGEPDEREFNGEIDAPDRLDFLNSQGDYENTPEGVTTTGVDDIDLWIGGLAEKKMPFGGMLGSTFNFVFETQMEALQDGDRFYYLGRTVGLNFLQQLENNSFASMIMRNTDVTHLPGDVFSTPNYILEVDQSRQFNEGLGSGGSADPLGASIFNPLVIRNDPSTAGPDTNYLRFTGAEHVVLGGTDDPDTLIAGIGDDTLWGDGGNDKLEGGAGNDIVNGGDGDDIITDSFGDDNLKGGDGNDVISAGPGFDLILAGFGNDFVVAGEDPKETFGGGGDDFIIAGESADIVFAGEGNDWIEGGAQNDLLQGDNGDPFQASSVIGHDVIIGDGGDDDFDSESGDDIMVAGAGIDRIEGMLGFDWATYKNETAGIEADLNVRAFALPPLPGSPNAFLDRFDLTEGLSGTGFSDILRGDDANALTMVGHELVNFGLIRGLKDGANPLFHENLPSFTGGNILLGGAGSDTIEGRGGNDLIDGDAWLNVRLSVRDANDPDTELFSANSMAEFQAQMFSGAINPGQIRIVREILTSLTEDFDTALFSGNIDSYSIEGGGLDVDGDGYITVSHDDPILGAGQGIDGVDKVRNIERLQFADASFIISGANAEPVGLLTIIGTPIEDNPGDAFDDFLTVNANSVTDADNVSGTNPTGAITGPIAYFWQVELEPDSGVFVDLERDLLGEIVKVTGTTFRPGDDEVGLRLRVRALYQDANGVLEEVVSAPTDPIVNRNDAPVGALLVSDTTPAEDQLLTAIRAFTDADGTNGAVFEYLWEESLDGTNWVPIAGAITEFLAPTQEQVGRQLKVTVTYTDDGGQTESLTSAATAAVTNVNDAPFGAPTIDDTTPTETKTLTAAVDGIFDEDGTTGAIFEFQWQESADGENWSDIAGATSQTFTPGQAQVNLQLRVLVRYTDDFGANEEVASDPTIVTGDFVNDGNAGTTIDGTAGQDILLGNGGADTLNGGAEDDILEGGNGNDIVNGGAGNDTINFTIGHETDTTNGGDDFDTMNVSGTGGNNTLRVLFNGTTIANVAGGAVTNVEAFNADLGGGQDTLSYNPLSPPITTVGITVNLADGTASGFASIAGIENATGGSGADTFIGDANNNTFDGGAGADTYSLAQTTAGATITTNSATSAEAGTDTLLSIANYIGSQGNDNIVVNGGNNLVDGQGGDDFIDAGGGTDTVLGGAGNDTVRYITGNGADTMNGGADADTLQILGTNAGNTLGVTFNGSVLTNVAGGAVSNFETVTLDMLNGTDTLTYGASAAAVTVNLSAGTASGFTSIANVENVTGGNGADTITGRIGTNVLSGGGGADRFIAQVGDGNDTIDGDGGSDTYDLSGTSANAIVTNASASSADIGTDTLASIENLIGSQGHDTITLTGGIVNVIDGQGGNDIINANGGADTITGGAGNDTITGGTGNDILIFGAGFGNDTIIGFDALPGGGGQDLLRLNPSLGFGAGGFAANVAITSINAGADTLVTIGANTITLLGVAAADVNINDFTFGP